MVTLSDFVGTWRLTRQIDDRLGGNARFDGQAAFRPEGDGLRYTEEGALHLARGGRFAATRSYLWTEETGEIEVRFSDGRLFHRFRPGATAEAAHFCDPDQYDVRYDFTGWPIWSATWTVRGPRKDYTMRSHFKRL